MNISQKCRICLCESEFNVSLYGNYCRRTSMIDKILACLNIVIEKSEALSTICHKCAENIERYHDFLTHVKKCQMQLTESIFVAESSRKRHVTTYIREQVYDADYTFSFLEAPEEKKVPKTSSPLFSYYSPPNVAKTGDSHILWKTPRSVGTKTQDKKVKKPQHHSRDLFESQSQDEPGPELKSSNWRLSPNDSLLQSIRKKCFGRSDY